MLVGNEVQVPLRDIQTAVRSRNVRVLDVLVVQDGELPVAVLLALRVLIISDLAEDSHLLDKVLESPNVDGEA